VTAIELLSPSNKVDEAAANAYRPKQTRVHPRPCVKLGGNCLKSAVARFMVPFRRRPLRTTQRTALFDLWFAVSRAANYARFIRSTDESGSHIRSAAACTDPDVVLQPATVLHSTSVTPRGRYGSIDLPSQNLPARAQFQRSRIGPNICCKRRESSVSTRSLTLRVGPEKDDKDWLNPKRNVRRTPGSRFFKGMASRVP